MSAAAAQPPACKYGPKDCPFGKVCKFFHGVKTGGSNAKKAKKAVKEHVKGVQEKNNKAKTEDKKMTERHGKILKDVREAVKPLLSERAKLLSLKADFDKKYVSIDSKGATANPHDADLKVNDMAIAQYKSILANEFRGMNVPVRLCIVFGIQNTSASVNQAVVICDPAYSSEFPGLAALFEQVRTKSVRVTYHCRSSKVLPGATATPSGVGGLNFDTTTVGTAGSLSDIIDGSNHSVYSIPVKDTSGNYAITKAQIAHHTYHPPPLLFPNSTATLCVGGSWTSTGGSAGAVDVTGILKFYEINDQVNLAMVGVLMMWFDCEFRMRD